MTYPARRDRAVSLPMLVDALYEHWHYGLTSVEAARVLGLKPSTHVRNMMKELVREGLAYETKTQHRPNVEKSIYFHWSWPNDARRKALAANRPEGIRADAEQ